MDNWFKFVQVIAVPIVCGIAIWLWKLDERQIDFATNYATKEELLRSNQISDNNLRRLRDDITAWLQRIENKLDAVIERELNRDGE